MYDNSSEFGQFERLTVLIQIAKIINTFHRLPDKQSIAHGHLSPHNIFVQVEIKDGAQALRVKIDGFENAELNKYANMFNNYRNVSVYSAPEVLRQAKKVLEPVKSMDSYSFGVIIWELFHNHVPFDGDLASCTQCVLTEDLRPKISEFNETEIEEETQLVERSQTQIGVCSGAIADLIRECWKTDPLQRPGFDQILNVLWQETTYYRHKESLVVSSDDRDSFQIVDKI